MSTFHSHGLVYIYDYCRIDSGLFIMRCPVCGAIQASASERMYLPVFTSCSGSYVPPSPVS